MMDEKIREIILELLRDYDTNTLDEVMQNYIDRIKEICNE